MIFKAGEGAGRSGSFFFFSHDKKFIIKTMSKGEHCLFLDLIPSLSKHYIDNPDSLIAKIFGVFTVRCSRMDEVHIMLMENTLQIKDDKQLRYIFDLKGSRVDRKVKGITTKSTTLKDINFLMAANVNKHFTDLGDNKRRILTALRKDIEFLRVSKLMDYSLLLGIEKVRTQSMAEKKIM